MYQRPISKRLMILAAALAAMFIGARATAAQLTPDQVLQKIFDTFHGQKIKTMVYDEVRTVSTKTSGGGERGGMMELNSTNGLTYVMRTYYRSPDKHGYRMVTKPIKGFWPGNPNQQDAITMDERWMEKVRNTYRISLAKFDKTVRGRPCYIFSLVPRPGTKWAFPMTWYVDKQNFSILRFMELVRRNQAQTASTTGDIYYEKVKGHTVPIKSKWTTTVEEIGYTFDYSIRYENYLFNVPLNDSVFKVQPPPEPLK